MISPGDAISRVLRLMPDCWKDDYKLAQATLSARVNRAMALDAAPPGSSFDADHYKFMHSARRQQMPMTSLHPDNLTGSTGGYHTGSASQFGRRGGNDQSNRVSIILRQIADLSDDEFAELAAALNNGGGTQRAEDQETGYSPMQFGGSAGTSPADLIEPHNSAGTFSEEDPTGTGPRGTADSAYGYGQRSRHPPDRRRLAHDRQPQMSEAERFKGFASRFPDAAYRIDVWR